MYTRRKIHPALKFTAIVVVIIVAVILIGRLDFFGWVLRGLNSLVPSRPLPAYTDDEIVDFKARIGDLGAENAILREMVTDLRNRLEISETDEYAGLSVVQAEVIWRDHAGLYETVVINRGIADGINVGMPVVDSHGLVGRIIQARGAISKVELITSPDCAFGVIDQRSRELGITRGTNPVRWQREEGLGYDGNPVPPDILELEYLSPDADIRTDDVLITNGLSGITPEGLRVGQVDQIIQQEQDWFEILVLPFADLDHLENVAVVLYDEDVFEEIESLLNESEGAIELPPVETPGG